MWETGLLQDLSLVLHWFAFKGGRDGSVWRPGEEGNFSMKTRFKLIQRRTMAGSNLSLGEEEVYINL